MLAFAQTAAFDLLPFLLVVTIIVVVHELGHFGMARAFGIAVDRFSIGFGPTLWARRSRSGVEWRIAALPLGGYVRFAGDDNAASVPDGAELAVRRSEIVAREGAGAERRYLAFRPLWQRALVVLAGPAANFLLAIALFTLVFVIFGRPMTSNRIDAVSPDSAAGRAGFLAGDRVVAADGRPTSSFEAIQFYVQYRAGVPIDFAVDRDGRRLYIVATPTATAQPSPFGGTQIVGVLGLAARGGTFERPDLLSALSLGAVRTLEVTETTAFYLGRMVAGQVGFDQLHSFIGIAHASGDLTRQAVGAAREARVSWVVAVAFFLMQLGALISISVGLLNLLPIPVLDGGHLLFHAYEAVTRHPPGARLQAAGYRVGLALLVSLMLFASWNDLQRLRVFHLFSSLFS